MKVYAIAFERVDFGGADVIINAPIFVDEAKAQAFVDDLPKNTLWGTHFVQVMELVE